MQRATTRRLGLTALAIGASAVFIAALAEARGRRVASRPHAPSAQVASHAPAPAAPPALAPSAAPSIPPGFRCVEQRPQPFLVRTNWFTADEQKKGLELHQKAIRYRTEHYGYFKGFGRAEWNAHAPGHYAVSTTFMGLPIIVNKRVVPALACVEKALKEGPHASEYHPRGIGGIRYHNTYRGGEVSNHVYGIAMDMDSDVNTCCGCMGTWNQHPLCRKKVSSVYERTKLPPSWVDTFERHGFYWLGHDPMQDTMHFEFLGDPEKILEPTDSRPAAHAPAPSLAPSLVPGARPSASASAPFPTIFWR